MVVYESRGRYRGNEGTPAVYTQRRAQLIAIVYNIKAHLASFDSKYYFEGLRAVTFQIVSTCLTVNLLNYYNYIYKKKFLKYFDTLTYKKKECIFDLKSLP